MKGQTVINQNEMQNNDECLELVPSEWCPLATEWMPIVRMLSLLRDTTALAGRAEFEIGEMINELIGKPTVGEDLRYAMPLVGRLGLFLDELQRLRLLPLSRASANLVMAYA